MSENPEILISFPGGKKVNADFFGRVIALEYEDWPDQVVRGQDVFPHQPAGEIMGAHAPHTCSWESHVLVPFVDPDDSILSA
jgi:hypothetical protein